MPWATISASGVTPNRSARSFVVTTTAAPPSEIWEALPAVIVPSGLNAGFSFPRDSAVVSRLMPSSRATTTGSPFRWGISTGTTSSVSRPASQASCARWWERAAQASCSSRPIFSSAFTSSEESPMCLSVKVDHRPS